MRSSAQVGLSRKNGVGSADTVASVARSTRLATTLPLRRSTRARQTRNASAFSSRTPLVLMAVSVPIRSSGWPARLARVSGRRLPVRHAALDQRAELLPHLHRPGRLLAGAGVDQRIDDQLARAAADDRLGLAQQLLAGARHHVGKGRRRRQAARPQARARPRGGRRACAALAARRHRTARGQQEPQSDQGDDTGGAARHHGTR